MDGFGRIGLKAARTTPPGFHPPQPSPNVLKRCLLAGTVVVAEGDDGVVVGYAVCERRSDHAVLVTTMVEGSRHATAVIRRLVDACRALAPQLPFSAVIVLGDAARERVLETVGFVPGEVEPHRRNGLVVVTRRWWAEALEPSHPAAPAAP